LYKQVRLVTKARTLVQTTLKAVDYLLWINFAMAHT